MAKKITEIEAELQEWEFLQQLPKELEGFTLREGAGIKGNILNIASYGCGGRYLYKKRSASALLFINSGP